MIKEINNTDVYSCRITSAEEYVKLQHCVLNENETVDKITTSLNDLHVNCKPHFSDNNQQFYSSENSASDDNIDTKYRQQPQYFHPGITFSRDYWHKRVPLKKSAYVVAIITPINFMKYGAVKLDCGVYMIKKDYDGSPTKETCALLGVPVRLINDFIEEDSSTIDSLKSSSQLNYIDRIRSITSNFIYKPICKFLPHFHRCEETDLVLLNIEPRGYGRLEHRYPVPRFTIPGGTMEKGDMFNFESCGLREFKEETGLDITNCHEKISREKIQTRHRFVFMESFKKKIRLLPLKRQQEILTRFESMYYLVKLK
jgi:hypothetical protein